MNYTHHVVRQLWDELSKNYHHEIEYLQTVSLFLSNIEPFIDKFPQYFEPSYLRRFVLPDRIISFKVTWVNDQHQVMVNQGYRVQHNQALGPYKGGIRFHPSVNQSICKFLAFDQTIKNALTNTMIGGAKGGSDFDPKGKSEMEIMRFSQAFALALKPYIGPDWDIPAGDIGVGYRETGYMAAMIKTLRSSIDGTFTGKNVLTGGSLGRKEATGFGLCYIVEKALNQQLHTSLQGKKVIISGSGNVAIYAAVKAIEFGAIVVAMSDSNGYIEDQDGLDIDLIKQIKEQNQQRIQTYTQLKPSASFHQAPASIWNVAADIALPCATQNEISKQDVLAMLDHGIILIAEGANMPCSKDAVELIISKELLYIPGIAANAGGVAVSTFEMSQNAAKRRLTFDEVDVELKQVMNQIYDQLDELAKKLEQPKNFMLSAQLAGYFKVVEAMKIHGVI